MVAGLRPVGTVTGSRRLDLVIGLPLRNREELTNLLSQLYDPTSPNYHHYLSAQEFTRRFGPREEDYQAVVAFARSNHFAIRGTHPNRLLLDVNGAAAEIERALHLKLRLYQHPYEARTFYSPDKEPAADSRIPILSISGLDDFSTPRPMDLQSDLKWKATANAKPTWSIGQSSAAKTGGQPAILDATGSGPSGAFLGPDFRAAYAPGVHLDGTGESVGLLQFDNYYPGDIAQYEQLAGLPRVVLTNVLVNGTSQPPGPNNQEVALDIEMAVSMAPGLARVIVYEGTKGNDILNRMATDNQARQLSSSWSFGYQVDATREQIYQEFAAQGQSMFQASGDGGAYGAALYPPADDPFVTAVGGTALITGGAAGNWASETAWFGSGGGVSLNYGIPIWQRALSMAANGGSTTMRNVPDVAALADNTIWLIANNGQQGTVGGTSAAAPLWAGFAALVNQQAARSGQAAIGFLNPALYAIGQGPAYSAAFHDIVAGNNTNSASSNQFFAVPGYDLCTGWGSPSGSNLVNALLAPPDSLDVSPVSNQALTGPAGGPFTPATAACWLTNRGGASLSWSLGSTSVWLSISPVGGVLTPGGPGTIVSLGLNQAATNLGPGSYLAEIWFTNLNNGFYQQRQLDFAVVTPPVITSQPANQVLPAGATAQFAVGTGTNAFLSFQWQAFGTNLLDNGDLSGSTSARLTLSNVTANESGAYAVAITNAAGQATSAHATLSVTSSAPLIARQPLSQSILPGANALFAVQAFGDPPLTFQWRANGTNLSDTASVSGSRSSQLTIANVSWKDALAYSVVVSNALGTRASAEASLGVVSLTSPELRQSVLYGFTGGSDGAGPTGLSQGSDGRVYGATRSGGDHGSGTVFQVHVQAGDQVSTLYSFSGLADGQWPNGSLVQLANGALFGTTFAGGTNGFGTIFQLNTNGVLNTLFTLDHTNGVLPTAGPTLGADGRLYGTAYEGGIYHYGTIFRTETNGGFTTLIPFAGTNGGFPRAGLILGQDGNFYGTTYKGGAYGFGSVFSLSAGGALTTIVSFDSTNGAFPSAALTQGTEGSFYGTTTYGGAYDLGTIFRLTTQGVLTNLVSFTGGTDGSHPLAQLLEGADGNWYGSTSEGGSFNLGTVFRLSPDGAFTTIAQFDGFNGANPQAPLLQGIDGNLYGVAPCGGTGNQGVLFQLSVPSAAPQITSQPAGLSSYSGSTVALRVASVGSPPLFYQWQKNSTNLNDGGTLTGAQMRVLTLTNISSADAGSFSVLVSNRFGVVSSQTAVVQVLDSPPFFTLQPTNETLAPGAIALLSAGVLGNQPLTYQWRSNGTNLADAGHIAGSKTDTLRLTNVTQADNGLYTLVVTNALGSATSLAAVVSVVPVTSPGVSLQTLYWFSGGLEGGNPSQLVDGLDGYLYGSTPFGGTSRQGALFGVATNGGGNILVSFNQTNGAYPLAGLMRASNRVFYGSTSAGGAYDAGTLFAFTPGGSLSNQYAFSGSADGAAPETTLVEGVDGGLYGATSQGGSAGDGTIFRLAPGSALSTVYSFSGGEDGTGPAGPLLCMPDGNLYGLTSSGGQATNGSVFRLTPGGQFTTIYSFSGGMDGYVPVGGLIAGDDGYLYGATRYNTIAGFAFYGTLFKTGTNGNLTTLYALNFTDGSYPAAGLVQGTDGNFYGTTEDGGANNYGTVFRLTPAGVFSTLLEFDGFDDGAYPLQALTAGSDGALYGSTSKGGVGGRGTVFRVTFTGPLQITGQPLAQTALAGGSVNFAVAVTGGGPLWFQWQKNGTNLVDAPNISGADQRVLKLNSLALADAGNYSVIVTNAFGAKSSQGAALVVEVAPPSFQALVRTNDTLLLGWTTAAGRVYQLQARSSLAASSWLNVGSPVIANGAALTMPVPLGTEQQQYYRVVLLP